MADSDRPTAGAPTAPAGSPSQLRSYYLELAMAQLHCAAAAQAVGDVAALRVHLARSRHAIAAAEAIR